LGGGDWSLLWETYMTMRTFVEATVRLCDVFTLATAAAWWVTLGDVIIHC
jgi:hypothetical protein